jgi:hypothetical protein
LFFLYSIFSFMCMFCRSLFVLLYFFSFGHCVLFFDLWILIGIFKLQNEFSSNTVFKDPCIGTSVYLRVVFRCVRGKSFYENSVSLIVSLSPNPTKSTILVDNIIRILLIYIRCIFH